MVVAAAAAAAVAAVALLGSPTGPSRPLSSAVAGPGRVAGPRCGRGVGDRFVQVGGWTPAPMGRRSYQRSLSGRAELIAEEVETSGEGVFMKRKPYEEFLRDNWFGEVDVYNLPMVKTITEGKTTRLVKEEATGDILLGYKKIVDVQPFASKVVLGQTEYDDERYPVVEAVSVGSSAKPELAGNLDPAGLLPGDVILRVKAGSVALEGSQASLEEVQKLMATGTDAEVKVKRELFKPAWMEPKVWGDEGERQRTYFNEQKYSKLRKQRDKNYRISPGLNPKDITIFEKGRTDGGFGPMKALFQRSKMMGEGSFGQVFDGNLRRGGETIPIVLKRSKENVIGANEMLQLELILNQEIAERAPSVVSPFFGFIDVSEEEEGQIYDGVLSTGLWLVWEDLGAKTLDTYYSAAAGEQLPDQLLKILGGGGNEIRTLGKELFKVLSTFHSEGLVHRDIKPENLLVLPDGSLRLIDLGATASCLKRPISYEEGLGPQDPAYSSTADKFLIPADVSRPCTANLDDYWKTYLPDRFDVYSAGVVLAQASCPALRRREDLLKFQEQMHETDCDFELVKKSMNLRSVALDENGGAGWDFVKKCLTKDRDARLSASDALEHPFLKGAL